MRRFSFAKLRNFTAVDASANYRKKYPVTVVLKHFPTKAAGCKRERPLVPRTAEVKRTMGIFIFLLSRKNAGCPRSGSLSRTAPQRGFQRFL
ncbi:hypothetical protein D7X33_18115 [Butyricicoccus sp. 1XD8-22]|nr:hypothetical protein D7X33_18115 [Butyricicoccus sp. 1XD8-22]